MRPNPAFAIEQAITELGVGEALVSLLDEQARPGVTQRAFIVPPGSRIGPLTPAERAEAMKRSAVAGHYEQSVDRESAYERLKARVAEQGAPPANPTAAPQSGGAGSIANEILFGRRGPRGGQQTQGLVEAFAKSAVRAVGSQTGRALIRGVLGSLLRGR
jgi:hypothetical protein